jgi:superoxide dismutase, Cu-Zn family
MHDTTASSTRRWRRAMVIAPIGASIIAAVAFGATRASADTPFAHAILRDVKGQPVGRVQFYAGGHHTVVQVRLTSNANVTPEQFHGFHIHTGSDTVTNTSGCQVEAGKPAFASAGGHLKVDGQVHSQHKGDLQSLLVNADGSARSSFTTDRFVPSELEGRAIILHANADNFGNVPLGTAPDQYSDNDPVNHAAQTKTQNTGNAGDRVACGVIHVGSADD